MNGKWLVSGNSTVEISGQDGDAFAERFAQLSESLHEAILVVGSAAAGTLAGVETFLEQHPTANVRITVVAMLGAKSVP